MGKTSIEWTRSDDGSPGETWNPVTGCTKVSSGCKHCYAERVFPRPYPGRKFTDVRCHPERLEQPLRWRKPRRVFVNSMSDLFHEDVPDEFILDVFTIMAIASSHTFQVLTKRPRRMLDFLEKHDVEDIYNQWYSFDGGPREVYSWPLHNVWLGISCEDQATADERIPLLLQTPAAVRFLSCEPLLGAIRLDHIDADAAGHDWCQVNALTGRHTDMARPCPDVPSINWVIAGGESGPHARPMHPDWVRSLRDQCVTAGVPFFLKQWGEWAPAEQHENLPASVRAGCLSFAGDFHAGFHRDRSDDALLVRVGKKRAGRTLDGKTWDEFPA